MIFKHRKYFISLIICIISAVGILLWYLCERRYYSILTVTYGEYGNPLVTAEFQGCQCPLAVRVGTKHSLFLREDNLNQIKKKPCGTIEWRGRGGYTREASAYSIEKIKIGDLQLKNAVVLQSNEDKYGILGKFLGGEFNLLLDFPNDRIIACDTLSKLKAKTLLKKDWLSLPFEMHCSGILLNAKTDLGMCRLVVNTTCPLSCLSSCLFESTEFLISSSFVLGGEQFGSVSFESINLPQGLEGMDGFIGMDFLKEHAIYFDYKNKMAYIERPERYLESIPIQFSECSHPIINTSIEGNLYALELDLGSGIPFGLSEEFLQNLHKTEYRFLKWCDFTGKKYESPVYHLPEIRINNLKFANPVIRQEREDFRINTTIEGARQKLIGKIGLPILHKYNLFLDFPHSIIYACNDHITLQKKGVLSENLLSVPFTISDRIILAVEMDGGVYRLMLDTGATFTTMRAPFPSSTTKFQIGGHDFGKCSIRELDISSDFDCDGVLGIDFLWEHPVFIDYVNQVLYIDLQQNVCD